MTSSLNNRFRDAYHKIYGIIPELIYDGTYYRSPHLPSAMSPRRLQSHVIRLETRCADDWEIVSREKSAG
jgi:hypothetical protein